MYNDDVQWLSQNIFTHRDTIYGSGGYMRVSISTNTKDSLSFSAPMFVITISNDGISKSATLTYQKIFKLYEQLQEVVKAAIQEYSTKEASPDAQLHFKVGKSNFLTFEFLRGSQQNEPVVRMTISHGTSDSTKILMPFSPEFHAFISLIGDMVSQRKYLDWCLHLPNRFYLTEMGEIAKQIPGLIKSAVVQIDKDAPSTPSAPSDPEPDVDEKEIQEATETMQDLNAFMGKDMENIELDMPKFEGETETKPKKDKEDNRLFKWLEGDLRLYEGILMRCCEKENPIREIEKELNENYAEMDCFPGIKEKDMKSIMYLVGREYHLYNEQANSGAIKRSFSINKYMGDKVAKPINVEAALDLLFLHIIIKICREKIEGKTPDNYTNKTLLHLASSMYVSPFIFSFISQKTEIKSVLVSKFREAKELGMFKAYEAGEFKNYDFTIEERDIIDVVTNLEGYFSSDAYRSDSLMRHVSLFNSKSCLLNPDNGLNEEQIINQVVPFEMYILMKNKSIESDRKELLAYAQENNLDSNVVSIFVKTKPSKMIPIVKFFEDNRDEIPEESRIEFMNWIGEFAEKDYDLSDSKFPYDSFGEEAIKALYLWKPESEEKFTTYKKFQKAVINSVHDKNTILSMISHNNEEEKGETFADFYVNANKGKG